MPTKCPNVECGFINEDDVLRCEECGQVFIDLNIDDIFFPYKQGETFIKREFLLENKGGSDALVKISSDIPQLICVNEVEVNAKSSKKVLFSLKTDGLNPDEPFHGNLTLTSRGISITKPILFGRPPEPDIQPNEIKLGDIFKDRNIIINISVGNKQSGSLLFLGYSGELIDNTTFDKPKMIQKGKPERIEMSLNMLDKKLGVFQSQIVFSFGDGIGNRFVNIIGNIVEGPQINGEITYNSIEEKALINSDDEFEYVKNVQKRLINGKSDEEINIDLGDIPKEVRSKIQLQFLNPSKSKYGYIMSMNIVNETNGLSAGFDERGEKQVNLNMDALAVYNNHIIVKASSIGSQSFGIQITYDKNEYGLPNLKINVKMNVIELKVSKRWFGIDLGTTNSCIAYFDGYAKTIDLGDSDGYLYSFCSFIDKNDPNKYYIGEYAESVTAMNSIGVKSIKMRLGTDWSKKIGGRLFRAKDIAGLILTELISRARDYLGLQPQNAIITVPANSSQRKIEDTKEAYRMAGIEISDNMIIYEPEAVAYYYLLSPEGRSGLKEINDDKPYHVLTFDFGGGTLDISIVQVRKIGELKFNIEVLKSVAENLGGDNLDWELRRIAVNNALKEGRIKSSQQDFYIKLMSQLNTEIDSEILSNRRVLLKECERIKKSYSTNNADGKIAIPQIFENIVIEKKDYENACAKIMVEKARMFIQQALQSVGEEQRELSRDDIELVIMAGGSSYIPLVQSMIKSMFKNVQWLGKNAKTSVSMGAVSYRIEQQIGGMFKFSPVIPRTDARIGYMSYSIEYGRTFKEIFPQGTQTGTRSQSFDKEIPESGIYTLILARNRGINDSWDGNKDIETISQRSFNELKAGDKIKEYFELEKNGNIKWYIEHNGRTYEIASQVIDKGPSDIDDLGY